MTGPAAIRCVLLGLILCADASAQEPLLPVIPPATGEQCVEASDVMRRDHMRFLKHQRDETVHGGIRGARHSLVGCIDCHVQRDARDVAIPINGDGQFCESCHRYAGVSMDCFECHASVPAEGPPGAAGPAWSTPSILAIVRGTLAVED